MKELSLDLSHEEARRVLLQRAQSLYALAIERGDLQAAATALGLQAELIEAQGRHYE